MVMELKRFNLNRLLSDKRRYAAVITGVTCVRHRELIIEVTFVPVDVYWMGFHPCPWTSYT